MKIIRILFLFLIQFISAHAFAKQEKIIDNDSLLLYYLQNNPPNVDPNADAIILSKAEKIEIADNSAFEYAKEFNYTEERCFKILKKDALNLATFSIPTASNFTAKHINIYVCSLENGKLVKEKITKSDAIKEVLVKGLKVYKFNIPELKVGKILYYSFSHESTITYISYIYTYIPIRHVFQDQYPVVEASFDIDITNEASYKVYASNIRFDTIASSTGNKNTNTVCITPSKRSMAFQWKVYNLEPIREESHVNNFRSKLGAINLIYDNGMTHADNTFLNSTWQEALPKSEFKFFSSTFQNEVSLESIRYWKDSLKNFPLFGKIDSFRKTKTHTADDSLAFAKDIYLFVRDSIKTVYNNSRVSFVRSYAFAINNRKGTVTEKNVLLTLLLAKAGFISRNIILSTNQKLDINNFDPNIIDYLISVLIIGKDYYFLDPGFRFLPFGKLAPKCYNGTALVLNDKYASIEILPQAYKDKLMFSYALTPKDSSDGYKVKVEERYGKESAATMREFLKDDSTANKDYLKNLTREMKYNVSIVDWGIKNENLIDSQLIINYNLDLQLDTSNAFMYFNPFMKKVQSSNPFKDVERKYPIEFGVKPGIQYLFTMKLPANTTLEEFPENKVINFKNGDLSYQQTATFDEAKNTIYINYNFKSNAYEFPASDYTALRNFYDQVIMEQSKQIVLKKK
jgi:hypothetical protein